MKRCCYLTDSTNMVTPKNIQMEYSHQCFLSGKPDLSLLVDLIPQRLKTNRRRPETVDFTQFFISAPKDTKWKALACCLCVFPHAEEKNWSEHFCVRDLLKLFIWNWIEIPIFRVYLFGLHQSSGNLLLLPNKKHLLGKPNPMRLYGGFTLTCRSLRPVTHNMLSEKSVHSIFVLRAHWVMH